MKIFFKRIGAFLIDCTILYFAITLVGLFVPVSSNVNDLSEKTMDIMDKYVNQEISEDKFIEETNNLNYEISKATYLNSIVGIVIYILYFVVYQSYNNGQTFGKKWLKLQVCKENGTSLGINDLLLRALIPYGLFINILSLILLLVLNKSMYISISGLISNVHLFVIVGTLILMAFKNKGLHDMLAKTKVEQVG